MKTWQDVYKLPLKPFMDSWVYDSEENFVFQFIITGKELQSKMLKTFNGEKEITGKTSKFIHEKGIIKTENQIPILQIRGWGNLTGAGAMNLPTEEAAHIQDTLAEYLLSKLNGK